MAKLTIELREKEYQYLMSRCSARRKGKYISDLILADMEGQLRLEGEKIAYYHGDSKKKKKKALPDMKAQKNNDDDNQQSSSEIIKNRSTYYHGDSKKNQDENYSYHDRPDFKKDHSRQEEFAATRSQKDRADVISGRSAQGNMKRTDNSNLINGVKEPLPESADNQFLDMFSDFE